MNALVYTTLKVVIDGQAYLHAFLSVGGDAPDDVFKEAMLDYKKDTAELIQEELNKLEDLATAEEE